MSGNMGHIKIKIIGNSHVFFDSELLMMCKNHPKLVAELNFCGKLHFIVGNTGKFHRATFRL